MNIGAIGKKLGQLVIVILIVSFGTFVLASLIPGDPAVSVLGEGRTPAEYEEVRQQLGLNDPLLVRYWDWLTSALQGDLGNSLVPPQQDVLTAISSALSRQRSVGSDGSGHRTRRRSSARTLVGAPRRRRHRPRHQRRDVRCSFRPELPRRSVADHGHRQLARLVPAITVGAHRRQPVRKPFTRNTSAITISLLEMAMFTRVLRSDLVTTLREDYILASKAKGMPTLRVLFSDALRPSSFSLITMMGLLSAA